MMNIRLMLWATMLACSVTLEAKVTMPQLFQNGMILQRGKAIPVWGKADAGEAVTVTLNKKKVATVADADGRWRVDLPQMKAGGPYTLEVNSDGVKSEKILLDDVFIGDVWLLSGQSNIDVTIERVYPNYTDEIDDFSLDKVRLFRVQNDTDTHGVKDDIRPTSINWKPLTKQNAWLFSAVGSFLGKRMFEKTGVAQGIIVNSWGGTPIEAWISADSLRRDYPMLVKRVEFFQNDNYVKAQAQANGEASRRWNEMLNKEDNVQSYAQPDFQDNDWSVIDQNNWNWRGTGSVWLRQHITIDKAHAGKPARLLLGTLYDQDVTYLNGRQIGQTGYQYPPRRYDIPEGLLQEGDNVITIRFINKNGAAHFIPEKPYMLCFGDDRLSQNPMPKDVIPLSPSWKFHLGAEMPPCPGGDVSLQNLPTTLYNAVLHPLAPFALSGVVWYQGESNVGNPAPYADYLEKLIGCWRDRWQQPELPFVVVQLANYDGRQQTGMPRPITYQATPVSTNSNWAQLREAQRLTAQKMDNVELATAIDLGETVDIHPLRKREVAERIGLCFDRLVYKDKKVKLMPQITSFTYGKGRIILTFDQPLRPCGELFEFEVVDKGGRAYNATAHSEGRNVIIDSPIDYPKLVRHAWKDNPLRLNAYAETGLPVGPFELLVDRVADYHPHN
ncbi:MAG: sialate O-acetylesterase [Prevotella sp.]|nr:sialate O-acetylesterase [Prevotella sp.]